jgi:pimeloyl-ACP methyl ester carboxylesterase
MKVRSMAEEKRGKWRELSSSALELAASRQPSPSAGRIGMYPFMKPPRNCVQSAKASGANQRNAGARETRLGGACLRDRLACAVPFRLFFGTNMNTITSNDGTTIAYDVAGSGPTAVIVDGALTTRSSGSKPELVRFLSQHLTVYSYDRRGRGDSGDNPAYAVDREVEDIEALIASAGGKACLYGHSSGAALAFEAALKLGNRIKALAMYEAPYNDDAEAQNAWKEYRSQLADLLNAGRGGDAVALFMKLVGMPAEQISGMRHAPVWPMFEALGPTLAYDHIGVMGDTAAVPIARAAHVTIPVLVMSGSASYPFMSKTALALSKAFPNGRLRALAGQTHDVNPETLSPVLVSFFRDH